MVADAGDVETVAGVAAATAAAAAAAVTDAAGIIPAGGAELYNRRAFPPFRAGALFCSSDRLKNNGEIPDYSFF